MRLICFFLALPDIERNCCILVMPRLLRALSDYTNIKELYVEEQPRYQPMRRFARPLLESMFGLLSGSISPALFPSLQILKITINYDRRSDLNEISDYISHYIEPLLSRIRALRPPNLTTIVVERKRV